MEPRNAVKSALQTIGGMGAVVKPGDRVLIKPNLCGSYLHRRGVTTSMEVIEEVVNQVRTAEGKPIIGESSRTDGVPTQRLFEASGLKTLAQKLDVELVNLDEDESVTVDVPSGILLRRAVLARTALECDVRISIPSLKRHEEATISLSLKNMVGCLPGMHKKALHLKGLHQSIADLNTVLKPHLAIIDGLHAHKPPTIIAGFDPVSVDAVGARLLGLNPESIEHLKLSAQQGLGILDLKRVSIKRGITSPSS